MKEQRPASPVCFAAEAEDGYMGYASREEILAALNELLEAERAGVEIARASAQEAPGGDLAELMKRMRGDEAHWCAILTRQIRRLGGQPSVKTGGFFKRAMAIRDLRERAAFLSRRQSWVVRKLQELGPRIRDDTLYATLRIMRERHQTNIALTRAYLNAHHLNPARQKF